MTADPPFKFPSVNKAVQCAVDIQDGMIEREVNLTADQRLRLRIGVNLGDVIVEGTDIYGDGVNIAARLESLADPGGVCISGLVFDMVEGKHNLTFENIGPQQVKNINEPIRAFLLRSGASKKETLEATSEAALVPEKPSIAVLPFENMSRDPEQELFCDGITEDIITALSNVAPLFVVARNSTFVYKDRNIDIRQVGREQGVRYVLEGSVRRSGDRLRVSAQLIDCNNGLHIWAERYDRTLTDVFAVQDDITREITTALQIELTDGEQARIWASGTKSFEAWELCLKGGQLIDHNVREDNQTARNLIARALELDSDYAMAWCWLGWTYWCEGRHNWSGTRSEALAKAREAAERAHQLSPTTAQPLGLLAMVALQEGCYEEAEQLADQVVERGVGQSAVIATAAMVLSHCGRPDEAIVLAEQAMRLCPIYPNFYRVILGRACYLASDYDRAILQLRVWQENDPEPVQPVLLAAALHDSGQKSAAHEACQEALRNNRYFTINHWKADQTFKDPGILSHLILVLQELGVPD